MTKARLKNFRPIVLFFIIINALAIVGRRWMQGWEMDQEVVIIGNLVLFIVTLLSFILAIKGLSNPNPNAFFRSIYSSMMFKLFFCAIAAFVYISIADNNLNKLALFTCMGLYLVYTFMEVSVLTKLLKQKPNV